MRRRPVDETSAFARIFLKIPYRSLNSSMVTTLLWNVRHFPRHRVCRRQMGDFLLSHHTPASCVFSPQPFSKLRLELPSANQPSRRPSEPDLTNVFLFFRRGGRGDGVLAVGDGGPAPVTFALSHATPPRHAPSRSRAARHPPPPTPEHTADELRRGERRGGEGRRGRDGAPSCVLRPPPSLCNTPGQKEKNLKKSKLTHCHLRGPRELRRGVRKKPSKQGSWWKIAECVDEYQM